MPNLCSFNQCCGCSACYAACSKSAISMYPDNEGFLRPLIDKSKCIDCKLCEKVCPVLHRSNTRKPITVYAAKANDDILRLQSSSGGIFSLLARQVFGRGGIVYGAAIRKNDLMVYHRSAEDEDELSLMRGSKYVQSEMGDTYRRVRSDLEKGRQVLFSGTPCQIAGLRTFLGREYDNLLCVDVICHAVPSPLAWQKYLEARAAEIMGRGSAPNGVFDYRRIFFRRKNCGWKRYALSLGYASDKAYLGYLDQDLFLRGFLNELYNRPSCYNCSFRSLRSGSDVTIADYWGVADTFQDLDDDKGTSAVLVNTDKGAKAIVAIGNDIAKRDSSFSDIVQKNESVCIDCFCNQLRDKFFKAIDNGCSFDKAVINILRPSLCARMRSYIGRLVRKTLGRRK